MKEGVTKRKTEIEAVIAKYPQLPNVNVMQKAVFLAIYDQASKPHEF